MKFAANLIELNPSVLKGRSEFRACKVNRNFFSSSFFIKFTIIGWRMTLTKPIVFKVNNEIASSGIGTAAASMLFEGCIILTCSTELKVA